MKKYFFLFVAIAVSSCGTTDDAGTTGGNDVGSDPSVSETSFDTVSPDGDGGGTADSTLDTQDVALDMVDAASSCSSPSDEIQISLEQTPRWQRGPVSLVYGIVYSGDQDLWSNAHFSTDNVSYFPATPLDGYGDGLGPLSPGTRRFVWDSFADLSDDLNQVWLKITVDDRSGACSEAVFGPFELLDDPDRVRAVVLTNSINDNRRIRRLQWDHGLGLSFSDEVYTTDAPPDRVVFEPGGKVAVTFGEEGEDLTVFVFGSDGSIAEQSTVDTAGRTFSDGQFSADGATLFLLDPNPTDYGGGIYTFPCDPWTGRPHATGELTLLFQTFAAASFDLFPNGQGLAVVSGSQNDPRGDLLLQTATLNGTTIDEAFYAAEGSLNHGVVVSPNGSWLLAAHMNFYDEDAGSIVLFRLDAGLIEVPSASNHVDLTWPSDIAFHTESGSAVVTQILPDRVIGLAIGDDGTLSETNRLTLGAADRIGRTSVGSDNNVFLIATIHPSQSELGSGIGMFELDGSGTVSLWCESEPDCDNPFYLGSGVERIPADVAVQP